MKKLILGMVAGIGAAAFGALNGTDSYAIGPNAGLYGNADRTIAVGNGAAGYINGGDSNVIIGAAAGVKAKNISSTFAAGHYAIRNAYVVNGVVAIGEQAARGASGVYDSVFVGREAGLDSSGIYDSVFIGNAAGLEVASVNDMVAIGSGIIGGGDNSVTIGSCLEAEESKVKIGYNGTNTTPRIECDATGLKVNGVAVSAGASVQKQMATAEYHDPSLTPDSLIINPRFTFDKSKTGNPTNWVFHCGIPAYTNSAGEYFIASDESSDNRPSNCCVAVSLPVSVMEYYDTFVFTIESGTSDIIVQRTHSMSDMKIYNAYAETYASDGVFGGARVYISWYYAAGDVRQDHTYTFSFNSVQAQSAWVDGADYSRTNIVTITENYQPYAAEDVPTMKLLDARLSGCTFGVENGAVCVYTNGIRAGTLAITP